MLSKKGDRGVGALQQILLEGGFSIDTVELSSGVFGNTTEAAVKSFQATSCDSRGEKLTEDGIVGPKTLWALTNPNKCSTGKFISPGWYCVPSECRPEVRQILTAAIGQIGTHEEPEGSNGGPMIDKFGARGQPWCAYFVSWCYRQRSESSPLGTQGSTYKIYQWGLATKRILGHATIPLPGDIFLIMRDNFRGHAGLIGSSRMEDGQVVCSTIEGNSSNAVRGLLRSRKSFSAVVRPIPLV